MKILNIDSMTLVHRGEDWPYPQNPCTKEMMGMLEKNERFISWLQPPCSKTEDQIPALKVHGVYYMLSLRMMKCIWRHVRLHKGFINYETALYGGKKLKIPMSLYIEKIRTQKRFNMMRMEHLSHKDVKPNQNASSKISQVVQRILTPLLDAPIGPYVSFQMRDNEEVDRKYLQYLSESNPDSVKNKDSFIQKMSDMYDETHSGLDTST